jgi:hypothetical protein
MNKRPHRRPRKPTTSLVTTSVVEGIEVFRDHACCEIFLRTAAAVQRSYGFDVLAYVLLPESFRWILHLGRGRSTVSDVMRDLKKISALEIMSYLEKEHRYDMLEVFSRSARRLVDQHRRFWQPHFEEIAIGDLETLRSRVASLGDDPVRLGLVQRASDYPYSAVGFTQTTGSSPIALTPPSELEWIS